MLDDQAVFRGFTVCRSYCPLSKKLKVSLNRALCLLTNVSLAQLAANLPISTFNMLLFRFCSPTWLCPWVYESFDG